MEKILWKHMFYVFSAFSTPFPSINYMVATIIELICSVLVTCDDNCMRNTFYLYFA